MVILTFRQNMHKFWAYAWVVAQFYANRCYAAIANLARLCAMMLCAGRVQPAHAQIVHAELRDEAACAHLTRALRKAWTLSFLRGESFCDYVQCHARSQYLLITYTLNGLAFHVAYKRATPARQQPEVPAIEVSAIEVSFPPYARLRTTYEKWCSTARVSVVRAYCSSSGAGKVPAPPAIVERARRTLYACAGPRGDFYAAHPHAFMPCALICDLLSRAGVDPSTVLINGQPLAHSNACFSL